MERRKTEPVNTILAQWLRLNSIETPLAEYRLIKAWPEVVVDVLGDSFEERIKKATGNIYINAQILHVALTSPVLRQQLRMQAPLLVARLNQASGSASPIITGIAYH